MIRQFYTSVAIGVLFVGSQATAQTATDVVCAACVGTDDLAAGAVTTNKIANGGVKNADLGSNAVTSGKIQDGNVAFVDLSNEVQGFLGAGIANITTLAAFTSAGGGAVANCPSDRIPISANCACTNDGGTRNYGVVQACFVEGDGAVAGCFPEALSYNPLLPNPLAQVRVLCLGAESYDGTPWVPTNAGLVPDSSLADGTSDIKGAEAAKWHADQHAASEAAFLKVQKEIANYENLLRQK